MTPRITALAIHEAATSGDTEVLNALLARHEEFLADLGLEEAREVCALFDEAEAALREQMREIQKELGSLRNNSRNLKHYKSAA